MLNYLFDALQICLTSKAARILIEILSRKLSQDGRIIFAVQIKSNKNNNSHRDSLCVSDVHYTNYVHNYYYYRLQTRIFYTQLRILNTEGDISKLVRDISEIRPFIF